MPRKRTKKSTLVKKEPFEGDKTVNDEPEDIIDAKTTNTAPVVRRSAVAVEARPFGFAPEIMMPGTIGHLDMGSRFAPNMAAPGKQAELSAQQVQPRSKGIQVEVKPSPEQMVMPSLTELEQRFNWDDDVSSEWESDVEPDEGLEEVSPEAWNKALLSGEMSANISKMELSKQRVGLNINYRFNIRPTSVAKVEVFSDTPSRDALINLGTDSVEESAKRIQEIIEKINGSNLNSFCRDEIHWRDSKNKDYKTGYATCFVGNRLVEFIITVFKDGVSFERSGGNGYEFWNIKRFTETLAGEKEFDEEDIYCGSGLKLTLEDNDHSAKLVQKGRFERNRADELASLAGAVDTNPEAFLGSQKLWDALWTIATDRHEHNTEIQRNATKILADTASLKGFNLKTPSDKMKSLERMKIPGEIGYQQSRLVEAIGA